MVTTPHLQSPLALGSQQLDPTPALCPGYGEHSISEEQPQGCRKLELASSKHEVKGHTWKLNHLQKILDIF